MKSETREIVIGAVTFACLAVVLSLSYGGRDLAERATTSNLLINASFNRVDGLGPGDDVRLGGIKVGTVSVMSLDDKYRAVITMKIAEDIRLPTDSSAAIHTDGLFGSKFMVLEPGSEEKYLKSGDEITYTQGAIIVSELLELIISEGRAAMKKRREMEKPK